MGCAGSHHSSKKPGDTAVAVNPSSKRTPASNMEYDGLFKILLVGDSGVGKSSLLLRFADNTFTDSFIATIGVDFKIRSIDVDGKVTKFQMWDTAGQERFRTITSSYYRGAHAILVCYDITDMTSYNSVKAWLQEIDRYACENVTRVIIGLKTDLELSRVISEAEAREFCDSLNLPYFEASSKDGTNIENLFTEVGRHIWKRLE